MVSLFPKPGLWVRTIHRRLIQIACCALVGLTGCVSAYKQVVVKVSDKETGQPIAGVQVATDYRGNPTLARGSRRPSRAVTDERGIAVLSANLLPERRLLGFITLHEFSPSVSFSISNNVYKAETSAHWTWSESLFTRPEGFVPTTPDWEEKLPSEALVERWRLKEAERIRVLEAAVDATIRDRPDYWPDLPDRGTLGPDGRFIAAYYRRRWTMASTNQLGSAVDRRQIKRSLWRALPGPQLLGEIRWISTRCALAECYSGPGIYLVVLVKEGEEWRIIARHLRAIS